MRLRCQKIDIHAGKGSRHLQGCTAPNERDDLHKLHAEHHHRVTSGSIGCTQTCNVRLPRSYQLLVEHRQEPFHLLQTNVLDDHSLMLCPICFDFHLRRRIHRPFKKLWKSRAVRFLVHEQATQ